MTAILFAASACAHGEITPPLPAAELSVASGDGQTATAGTAVTQPIVFRLTDRAGRGVPDTEITFQVIAGEGILAGSATTIKSDKNGVAVSPTWTLGKLAVAQQIRATSGTLEAVATASVKTQYHGEVRYFGSALDSSYAAAFERAMDRVNAEIVGAMTPVTFSGFPVADDLDDDGCGATGVAPLFETVQTMIVYVTARPIDGPGGVLAQSGPCIIRDSNYLTVLGVVVLDVADLPTLFSNGQLNDVAFHELQHVLGFGTLWTQPNPPLIANSSTPQAAFVGPQAIQACLNAGGGQLDCVPGVLLDNIGGSATRNLHWRKAAFKDELMTGYLAGVSTPMPLSAMTIAAQADLGYVTNINAADSYAVSSATASSLEALRTAQALTAPELREQILTPRFAATGHGVLKRLGISTRSN